MAAIQRKIEKLNERSVLSRHFHAKTDRDMIAAWKSDLNRILLVFNVSRTAFFLLFLTTRFQTEFAVNTHVVAAKIHRDVANTQNMVSDIHHTIVHRQEGVGYRNQSVGNDFAQPVTKQTLTAA